MEQINQEHIYPHKIITQETIYKWERIFKSNPKTSKELSIDNDEVFFLHTYNNEPKYLKVLRNDVKRSRVKDRIVFDNYQDILEKLLMFYCEVNSIDYRQGMNEIMGPLLLLNKSFDIPLHLIYNLFTYFIHAFMTNYYSNKELYALKGSLNLLTLLLMYHEPELYQLFKKADITPEMYGTNWILTTFANKVTYEVVLLLWDFLIEESDELMIHYLTIAFLHSYKDNITTNRNNPLEIPEYLCQMNISNCSELQKIIEYALMIRDLTPISFSILVNEMEIFKPNSTMLKVLNEKYAVNSMLSFPIFPSEVLYASFKNILSCPDIQCKNFENIFLMSNNSDIKNVPNIESNEYQCYQCKYPTLHKHDYYLIDLRIIEKDNKKNHKKTQDNELNDGFLPQATLIDNKSIEEEGFIELLEQELLPYKNNHHFILITSYTNYFNDYQEKFYLEKNGKREYNNIKFGLQLLKENEIDAKAIEKYKKKNINLKTQLKEYEILTNLIKLMQRDKFPYVSYVYGGYDEIHDLSLRYSIPLLSHNTLKCSYCLKYKEMQVFNNKEHVIFSTQKTEIDSSKSHKKIRLIEAIEMKTTKELSSETFDDYCKSPLCKIYHCFLIRLDMCEYTKQEKIVVITNKEQMMLVKLVTGQNNDLMNKKKLLFPVVKIVNIQRVVKVKKKSNVITIVFMSQEKQKTKPYEKLIEVDLCSITDGTNFCNDLKEKISKYNKE